MIPEKSLWTCFTGATLFLIGLFIVVFGGCDYLTGIRTVRYRIDFAFEQDLPFLPGLSMIYSSLYAGFAMMFLLLRTKPEIYRFVRLMTCITIAAGIGFLLLPAELQFQIPEDHGRLPTAFEWADRLNLTYNLCPSLHVSYGAMNAEVFRRKSSWLGLLGHLWAIAIAVSAWTTYQHHLVDLISGYALALVASKICGFEKSLGITDANS